MKALHITSWVEHGKVSEQITFGDVKVPPPPKGNSVVIQVCAASIQVDDIALLQNTWAGGTASARKPQPSNPLIGGTDYAGFVIACGPKCKKLKVGDRVCGIMKPLEYQPGTWAEQTSAPENDVCPLNDDSLSFVDAAAVQMGTLVGHDMIKYAKKKLEQGENCRILVLGASGAIGSVLLQMLKKYNAYVVAVCSGNNMEKCKTNGATEVI
eukprot:g3817.t1